MSNSEAIRYLRYQDGTEVTLEINPLFKQKPQFDQKAFYLKKSQEKSIEMTS